MAHKVIVSLVAFLCLSLMLQATIGQPLQNRLLQRLRALSQDGSSQAQLAHLTSQSTGIQQDGDETDDSDDKPKVLTDPLGKPIEPESGNAKLSQWGYGGYGGQSSGQVQVSSTCHMTTTQRQNLNNAANGMAATIFVDCNSNWAGGFTHVQLSGGLGQSNLITVNYPDGVTRESQTYKYCFAH